MDEPIEKPADEVSLEQPPEDMSLIKELWFFMMERKAWWITPIVVLIVLFGALIVLAQGSAVAPFIYTIF